MLSPGSVLSVAALLISLAATLAALGWAGRAEERAERGDRRDEERFERECELWPTRAANRIARYSTVALVENR
jgi:hypothetical protein